MNLDDIQTHSFFKDESGEVWFVDWYYTKPVVSLVSTDSGYRKTFAVDDPLGQHMEPMEMDEKLEAQLRKMAHRAVRGFGK